MERNEQNESSVAPPAKSSQDTEEPGSESQASSNNNMEQDLHDVSVTDTGSVPGSDLKGPASKKTDTPKVKRKPNSSTFEKPEASNNRETEISSDDSSDNSTGNNKAKEDNSTMSNQSYANETFNVAVKKRDDIEPLDVLPVYADAASGDQFWLFLVTNTKSKKIEGRWMAETNTRNIYILERVDKVPCKCIMRTGKKLDNFYVLPKFLPSDTLYRLSDMASSFLSRDVASFYSGLD